MIVDTLVTLFAPSSAEITHATVEDRHAGSLQGAAARPFPLPTSARASSPESWPDPKCLFGGAREVSTIDGVRAEYDDGFGLARPSNTTPVVVMRFEGDTKEALDRIMSDFRDAIMSVAPGVKLPF